MDTSGKELMATEFKTNEKCNKDYIYPHFIYEKRSIKRSNLRYRWLCSIIEQQVTQSCVCVSFTLIMVNITTKHG